MTDPSPAREWVLKSLAGWKVLAATGHSLDHPETDKMDLNWSVGRTFHEMERFAAHVTAPKDARIAELEKVTELIVPAHLEHAKELREKDAECSRLREEVERLKAESAYRCDIFKAEVKRTKLAGERAEAAEQRADALASENAELKAKIAASLRETLT